MTERCSTEPWPGSGGCRTGPDAGAVAIRAPRTTPRTREWITPTPSPLHRQRDPRLPARPVGGAQKNVVREAQAHLGLIRPLLLGHLMWACTECEVSRCLPVARVRSDRLAAATAPAGPFCFQTEEGISPRVIRRKSRFSGTIGPWLSPRGGVGNGSGSGAAGVPHHARHRSLSAARSGRERYHLGDGITRLGIRKRVAPSLHRGFHT
jgi:hypothetical protein